MATRSYRYFDVVMAFFVTVLLLSNLLSSAKIVDLSIGPVALVYDAGTLIFPLAYIFGDILTEVYGYRRSRRIIWVGFAALALMAALVWLVGALPGEGLWRANVGDVAYNNVLGGIPVLAVASLAAYWLGEFSNSYVLARMKVATKGRWLWSRTIGSTIVGQGMDTGVFILVATLLGAPGFVPEIMLPLLLSNYVFKVGVEVVFTPVTLAVVNWLKKAEQEDVYDRDTNFNPFRLEA